MKKGECKKCHETKYLEKHHPLPRNEFKHDNAAMEFKEEICPNCHTEFHVFLKKLGLKGKNYEEHLTAWYYWLYGFIIVIGAVYFLF